MASDATKYKLNNRQREKIRSLRAERKFAAENLSVEQLHKSKAWLAQLERGRIDTIKEKDLVLLLSVLYNTNCEEIISNGILKNFLNINEQSIYSGWFQNKRWNAWDKFNEEELSDSIKKELKKLSMNIEALDEKNIEPNKTKYILWRTLQAINSNITFNFELFSLLSSINLKVLKDLGPKIQDIEIEKIYDLYNEMEKYQETKSYESHPNIDSNSLLKLDATIRCISVCKESNNLLLQLLTNPENESLIEDYNKNVHTVEAIAKFLKLDKSELSLSSIEDISSDNDTIQNSMIELLKVLQTLKRQQDLYSNEIKNVIKKYEDFLLAESFAKIADKSKISGIPLSKAEE